MNVQAFLSIQNLLRHKRHHSNKNVLIEEQIAYITKYYPTPRFVEMDFDSANAEKAQKSQEKPELKNKHHDDQTEKDEKLIAQSVSQKENLEYPVSQIEGESIGNLFNTKRTLEGRDMKSLCASEAAYKQLLAQMNGDDKVIQKFSFSAKKQYLRQPKHHLFGSEKKPNGEQVSQEPNNLVKRDIFGNKRIEQKPKVKVQNDYKWDSPKEIEYRRKNKLKWFQNILYLRYIKNLQSAMQKIKDQVFMQPCPKCQKPRRKNEYPNLCSQCQKQRNHSMKVSRYFR